MGGGRGCTRSETLIAKVMRLDQIEVSLTFSFFLSFSLSLSLSIGALLI